MKTVFAITLFLTSLAAPALAGGLQGSISFSSGEISRHAEGIRTIMQVSSACLQKDLDTHQAFHHKWGISAYYGSAGSFAKASPEGRRQQLSSLGFNREQVEYLLKTLQPTSCIGLTLKCLGEGFAAAGQKDIFAKVKAFTQLNGVTGNALQHALQQLDWKILYWNPNPSRNAAWDLEEQRNYPGNPKHIWGQHEARYQSVIRNGTYLYNKVDDAEALVNFGRQVPRALTDIPFFVGIAHGGYHVFPGSFGQIIEGHSTRQLTDAQTVETSPFNPLSEGGGPRGNYYSGLMAVPPGYVR